MGSDPAWLCLWCRPAAAAPIQLLAWELLNAAGMAVKGKKKKKKKKKEKGKKIKTFGELPCGEVG